MTSPPEPSELPDGPAPELPDHLVDAGLELAGVGRPDEGLIARAPGDDVIVHVRMRRASFERMRSTADGRSVPVGAGWIGLVRDAPGDLHGNEIWTFVVWSGEPTWSAAGELIPGNQASVAAMLAAGPGAERDEFDDEDEWDEWQGHNESGRERRERRGEQ